MDFEEWAERENLSAYGKACSRAAWQAAQAEERERAKVLVDMLKDIAAFTFDTDSAEAARAATSKYEESQ